jgi:hypothetical protein
LIIDPNYNTGCKTNKNYLNNDVNVEFIKDHIFLFFRIM